MYKVVNPLNTRKLIFGGIPLHMYKGLFNNGVLLFLTKMKHKTGSTD